MLYLTGFTFPCGRRETDYILKFGGSSYPYHVIASLGIRKLEFEPITILHGSNGGGKTTVLNIIAQRAGIRRESLYNTSVGFTDYAGLCEAEIHGRIPESSCVITSDDVFDYIWDIRYLNEGIERKRDDVCKAYLDAKYADFQLKSIEDYEELKRVVKARGITQTKFVKSELISPVSEYSNGENAFRCFTEKIGDDGLYLLDEPENSLAPDRQLELKRFIEEAARFFGCQFIISTHSPFLLAMDGAKIYDLDEHPASIKPWTALKQVRIYYDFFLRHGEAFR